MDKYRILLVEDEDSLVAALTLNLEMEGYYVAAARDGHTALDKFRNQHFDLAILDVMIPLMDGFAVCQTVHCCRERVVQAYASCGRVCAYQSRPQ